MVNSFTTSGPHDIDPETGLNGFHISANNLDKGRLWKNIIENIQILNIIESLAILGEMYKSPCPKNPYLIRDWIREIMKKYKSLDYYVFLHQNKYVWYKKSHPKPKKLKYDEKYEIKDDGSILYKGEIYPKYGLILPGDNFMSLGFYSHPIVPMWMHHSDSLKLYINCHIDIFLKRGGKPGVEKLRQKIKSEKIEHPIWTLDPEFHRNHKAALLTKELDREEEKWYILKPDFKEAYNHYLNMPQSEKIKSTSSFQYYIWVFTGDIDNPRYIFDEEKKCCIFKNK